MWAVTTHKYGGESKCTAENCNHSYWEHKWNKHTLYIFRYGMILGLIFGLLFGAGIVLLLFRINV